MSAPAGRAATTSASQAIGLAWTVNETQQTFPATVAVFHRFGIDGCCGGDLTIIDAARRHDVDPLALLYALRHATSEAP